MPFFEAAALFKELVGSFHHAYFKAGMISGILKVTQLCCYYGVHVLPYPSDFGDRKKHGTLDLIHMELKKNTFLYFEVCHFTIHSLLEYPVV